jgi:hypothetical protein
MKKIFSHQEIILSPNRANVLNKGAFDGFPTGSVVEAGLCGVVMFVTDELKQNIALTDGEDCVFINHDICDITSKIMDLFVDRNKLLRISKKGMATLRDTFSESKQMGPRLNLIASYL